MNCINTMYTGTKGIYACVKPITAIPVPVVSTPDFMEFEPVQPQDYHITVAYDESAAVSRAQLERFIDTNCLGDFSEWNAAAVGVPQWWENNGKVYLGVHFYSPELFALHERIKSLGVVSSFDNYMCHMTFGRWKNIPEELRSDRVFMNDFVKTYVNADIPNIIVTSQLEFADVK